MQTETCAICRKLATPPNLVISKLTPYHLGCLAAEFDRLREENRQLAEALGNQFEDGCTTCGNTLADPLDKDDYCCGCSIARELLAKRKP